MARPFGRIRALGVALTLLAALGGLFAHPAPAPAAGSYLVADLGTLAPDNGGTGTAWAINATGQVVGYASVGSGLPQRAALWQGGTQLDLGTLRADDSGGSQARAINAAGQVVGQAASDSGGTHAFLVGPDGGTMTDLGTLKPGDSGDSAALGINDAGLVVGQADSDASEFGGRAFVYDPATGTMTDLGTLNPDNSGTSSANAINAAGQIVGVAEIAFHNPATTVFARHAFLYDPAAGSKTDLGTLAADPQLNSSATAINAAGHVVGSAAIDGSGGVHAFLWQGGALRDLGTLAPGNGGFSNAYGINAAGQIVGTASVEVGGGGRAHAFLWENGAMIDLNDHLPPASGWELTLATGINDSGQIAGVGTRDGAVRAFLLTPAYALALTVAGAGANGSAIGAAPAPGPYLPGTPVGLTPHPAPNTILTGWTVDGAFAGWAPGIDITMNADHAVVGTFAPQPSFGDVPPGDPAREAIAQLAARGIIRGCFPDDQPPLFCPGRVTNREEMAALIVRAMPGWQDETWPNPFADPTGDDELMRRVATLGHYQVAQGYQAERCAELGKAAPCFGPLDDVTYGQVLLFIARAMVQHDRWALQPDDRNLFPDQNGVPGADPETDRQTLDHRAIVTYVRYVGAPPDVDATPGRAFAVAVAGGTRGWADGAARAWFARAFWPALDRTFGVDQPGAGGYVP